MANEYAESGQQAVQPSNPTKTGFMFTGWYKDAACQQAWTFTSDNVIAATTLYAKWVDDQAPTYGGFKTSSLSTLPITLTASNCTDTTGVKYVIFEVYPDGAGVTSSMIFNAAASGANWSAILDLSRFGNLNGKYDVNVWAADTIGNMGLMGTSSFTVSYTAKDILPPTLLTLSPSTTVTTQTCAISCTATDNSGASAITSIVYQVSNGSTEKYYAAANTGGTWNATFTAADFGTTPNGQYTINVWGLDSSNNLGLMGTGTFTLNLP